MLPAFGGRFWKYSIALPRQTSSTICLQVSGRSGQSLAPNLTAFGAARDAEGSKCRLSESTAALQALFGPVLLRHRLGRTTTLARAAFRLSTWPGLLPACGRPTSSPTMRRPWWQGLPSKPTRGRCLQPSFGSCGGSGTMGSDVGRSQGFQPFRPMPRLVATTGPGLIGRCGCSWEQWQPGWTCSRLHVGAAGFPQFWSAGAVPQRSVAIACRVAAGAFDRNSSVALVQDLAATSAGWRSQRAACFIRGGTPGRGRAVGNRIPALCQLCLADISSVGLYEGRPAVGNRCVVPLPFLGIMANFCHSRGVGWERTRSIWADGCSRASLLFRDFVLWVCPQGASARAVRLGPLGLWNIMAGAYAVQAMEGDGAWSAATSLQLIAASRVREWRQKHRVQRDADFAFYFTSYEQAVRHHVADAWTVARAEQEGCLMSAASAAVEGQRRQIGRRCPGPLRLREGGKTAWRLPSPMVVSCESAGRSWQVGAFRPAGPLTDALRRERHVSWTERTGPQAHACHCLRPWSSRCSWPAGCLWSPQNRARPAPS